MRVKTFYRLLRIVSCFVLFFFLWSFGPAYAPFEAWAAEKKAERKPQSADKSKPSDVRSQRPEERFQTTLEALREHISKAEEKSRKGEEPADELAAIKGKRASLEELDSALKNDFAVTETRLKSAKLPKTILDRHYAFLKFYQDNMKELVSNLDALERVEKKSEVDAAVKKTKTHLEKTKPASRHQKLDPENLPFKTRKVTKTKAPRLTPDEYRRDFPQHKTKSKQKVADSRLLPDLIASRAQHKPVLLAFNDSVSDVPLQLLRPTRGEGWGEGTIPIVAYSDSSPYLLAQATDQPSAEDLAETPEVQFTDAIRAKAQELGNSPLKIYEYVRNNIEFAPTYGSIQGADQCLQSKICNDMDTASLLISLMRVSGIYSHYEYSTIEIPIDKAMNWVGGVTDPKMAGTILATNGIPAKVLISGSTIKAVQLEHVYVKAWIDYIPSRGAVHKQGDTWIPLDPSYKQYTYMQGIDISSAVPFDSQSFANQILSTATTNTTDGSVTNVNSSLVQQTMQDYQTRVQNYIQQNYPNGTVGDVLGKKEIVKHEFPYLMGTLPYKTVQIGSEFSQVPDNLRETMSFNIPDQTGSGTGLTYSTSLPQIAGKKITLSFSPATANDQAVIESLLPQPHSDGTPIQPSELPQSFPAYLINLKSELRIEGQVVATGSPVTMGTVQSFTMSLNEPGIGLSNIDNTVQAGEYFGIGLDTGKMGAGRLNALKTKLDSTKTNLTNQNYSNVDKDDIVGNILYSTITAYFAVLDVSDETLAKTMGVIRYRAPSVGMFSVSLNVRSVFGIPTNASSDGLIMDVDRLMQAVFSKDGAMDKVKQYMSVSGSTSSALEHSVPEQIYSASNLSTNSISAIKAIQLANDQGIPIYTATKDNIGTILPQLSVDSQAISDIVNAVNAGKMVTVQKSNINYNSWNGCGYIIVNPDTGAGAYMISGGMSGSNTNIDKNSWGVFDTVFLIVDLKFWAMGLSMQKSSPLLDIVSKKIGFFGVLVSFINDINQAFNDPNLTTAQKWAIGLALVGFACAAAALVLASGGLLGIIGGIFITLILNWLKESLIQEIKDPVPLF